MYKRAAQISTLCLIVFCVLSNLSYALNKDKAPTDEELLNLPGYCTPRIIRFRYYLVGEKWPLNEEYKKWESVLGPDYQFLHHYCMGLNWLINRKNEIGLSEQDIHFCLGKAEDEFGFVIKYSSDKLPLLPEILLKRADLLKKRNEFSKAIRDIYRAIKLKNDYVQAYLELSDVLNQTGSGNKAIKVLELGLRETNGSSLIKEKLTDIKSDQESLY